MTIDLLAPAKINLGLEVLGKRDDGFHEIATVFQSISIFDRLHMQPSSLDHVRIVNRAIQFEANLAERALSQARLTGLTANHWRVEIEKRIPVAAGLGGASADAAAVLAGLAGLGDTPLALLSADALPLGSDVPFLMTGGAALARGRGEQLTALPSLSRCWFVLVSPGIELDRKTARLYGALTPADFSDGTRVMRASDALRAGIMPNVDDLANAFEQPLYRLVPELAAIRTAFFEAGAGYVCLSGAGPTHFTSTSTLNEAIALSQGLRRRLAIPARVLVARPIARGPMVRGNKTRAGSQTLEVSTRRNPEPAGCAPARSEA